MDYVKLQAFAPSTQRTRTSQWNQYYKFCECFFSLVRSNHYKVPKNPYYRCMLAWNSLPVDISLLDSKESFTKAVKDTVHNPYIKVL